VTDEELDSALRTAKTFRGQGYVLGQQMHDVVVKLVAALKEGPKWPPR
jgi:hypothetical protein